MRKHFLKVSLIGLLAVSMPMSFTSCKDYDDDIEEINKTTDELSEQLAALKAASEANATAAAAAKTAADAAKAAADAAQNSADAAAQEAAAAKLEAELAKQAAAKAKQEAIDAAIAEIEKLKNSIATQEAFDKLATQVAAIEEGLNKTNGKVDANAAAIAQLQIQMKAVEAYKALIEANSSLIKENAKKIAAIETSITDIQSSIKALQSNIDALESEIEKELDKIEKQITAINADLVTILSKELRSLVFIPGLYADGIEAVEYEYTAYSIQNGSKPAIALNNENGVECKLVTSQTNVYSYKVAGSGTFNPLKTIQYHLNPSSAVVNADDLSFVSRDVEVISRGNNSVAKPQINKDFVSSNDGILSVGFTAEGKNIKTAQSGEGSVFALQAEIKRAEKEDTTITSDYALLYASKVIPQAIAFNTPSLKNLDCVNTNDEVYRTVNDAIANVPTLTVNYDGNIDLSSYLAIHYDWDTKTKNAGSHKVWAYGEEAHYGLHYEYALIDYLVGGNATSDSKYAKIDAKTGVLTPCIVDAQGNTLNQQGVSSIGRVPMVRVTVLDDANKVVLSAFIRVAIAHRAEVKTTAEFNLGEQKFGCNNALAAISWSEVSYQLLEMTATKSKAEFDALYQLVTVENNGTVQARQYASNNDANSGFAAHMVGEITERVDPTDATTTVLQWELTKENMQWVYEQPNHEYSIYVCYVHRVAPRLNPVIFMPFKISVSKPDGTVSEKNKDYWYGIAADKSSSKDLKDLDECVRLNVQYPIDGGNTLDYTVDFNQVWVRNTPIISATQGYPSFSASSIYTEQNGQNGGYKYYFSHLNNRTENGINYSVEANKADCIYACSDNPAHGHTGASATYENALKHALLANTGEYNNTVLKANGVEIAKLDQNTGKITYINNDEAKRLLNLWDAQEAKLYAYVGICAYNECGLSLALKDAVYPAYFLRPITVKDNDKGYFVDAKANGSYVNVFDVIDTYDWRSVKFMPSNSWLYAFYGVKGVTVDIPNITTDMNGSDINSKKLSDVTTQLKISYMGVEGKHTENFDLQEYNKEGANAAAFLQEKMGWIKYENNGNNVHGFTLRIPVAIHYDWGTINTTIDCEVKETM